MNFFWMIWAYCGKNNNLVRILYGNKLNTKNNNHGKVQPKRGNKVSQQRI